MATHFMIQVKGYYGSLSNDLRSNYLAPTHAFFTFNPWKPPKDRRIGDDSLQNRYPSLYRDYYSTYYTEFLNQAFETDMSSFFLGLNQPYLQFRNDLLQLIYRQESSFPLRFLEVVPRRQEISLHIDDQTKRLGQGQRVYFLHFQTVKGYSKFSSDFKNSVQLHVCIFKYIFRWINFSLFQRSVICYLR